MPLNIKALLILFLIIPGIMKAQQQGKFAYTTSHGLPNDNVTCLLQDKQGFLWVGTSNGLSRFDGSHFYTFPPGLLKSNRLVGDLILDLEEDGDHIWVSHRFGVSKINKYSFECKNFQPPVSGSAYSLDRAIRDICKDRSGNLWFAGTFQLLRYDKTTDSLAVVLETTKKMPPGSSTQISKIIADGSDRLYLLLVEAWAEFSIKNNNLDTILSGKIPIHLLRGENIRLVSYWNTFPSFFNLNYDVANGMLIIDKKDIPQAINDVRNIYVDSSLNVFVTAEKKRVVTWTTENKIIPGVFVNGITEQDAADFNCGGIIRGNPYWGRPTGLYIADNSMRYASKYLFSQLANDKFKRLEDIMDVKEYDEGRWLVGTKTGLYLMDRFSQALTSFPQWRDSAIYTMMVLPDQSVWLSTDNQLCHFDPATGKIRKRFFIESYAVAIHSFSNKLLVATRNTGLVLLDLPDGRIKIFKETDTVNQVMSNRITAVKRMGNTGNFLITYNMSGYSFNNFETGSYNPFTIPAAASVFNEKFAVTAILPFTKQLWVGQYIGGAIHFDSTTGSWNSFTTQSGLSSNYVNEIVNDKQGRIWIVTAEGVDIYDAQRKAISKFPVTFQTGGRTGGFTSRSGKLVFFDRTKIIEVDADLFSMEPVKSKILFSRVIQDKEQLQLNNNNILLPYNKNSLTIIFSLLKLGPGLMTSYSYRLKQNDSWTDIGAETELSFASLAPGRYDLQIRATDEFGQWSHYSDVLSVEIKPPFWKTWWFYLLIALMVSAILWMIYRYRINELKKIHRLRSKISQDLHDEVGATLSGVTLMSELVMKKIKSGNEAEVQNYIERIAGESKEMAEKMNDIVWAINPRNDSLEKVLNKVQAYAMPVCSSRSIRFHATKPDEPLESGVSMLQRNNIYLICKEAINNAVKHSGAGNIWFSLEKKNGETCITIRDDGKGFEEINRRSGEGLLNMKARAAEIKAKFTILADKENGTLVQLWVS